MRTTMADILDPVQCSVCRILNVSPTDSRAYRYVNQAQHLLLKMGKWWGTYARYAFCVDNSCITWPRQIAAIEAVAVCGEGVTIRNGWFEFLENVGIQSDDDCTDSNCCSGSSCGGMQFYDRPGIFCTFADIIGDNKLLRVYSDVAEAANTVITLQGYDENNNWIRTQVGGVWIDGEQVAITNAAVNSTKTFSKLTGVQKPETNGTVRLYEYDSVTTVQRLLATYEYDETNPSYRRSFIKGLTTAAEGQSCEEITVTVMAKHEFIPVKKSTDWLIIGNPLAIESACQAIRKKENNLFEEYNAYLADAVRILRDELRHYRGTGVVQPVRMQPSNVGGAAVINLI